MQETKTAVKIHTFYMSLISDSAYFILLLIKGSADRPELHGSGPGGLGAGAPPQQLGPGLSTMIGGWPSSIMDIMFFCELLPLAYSS